MIRPSAYLRTMGGNPAGRSEMEFENEDSNSVSRQRRREIFAFFFLTAVLMPALAIATVGGYGLAVWIYQIFAGPPGPPSPV